MIPLFRRETPLTRLLALSLAAGGTTEAEATGNPAAFETDVAKPLVSLEIPFTPIQAGSGDPSPTNVRAISGFTGVNIVRCGVNLWDEEWEVGDIDGNGQNTSGVDFRSKNYIPVIPGMKFYAYYELPGGETPGSNLRIFYYDRNKTYISNTWAGPGVKTVPANAYYMRFYGDSRFGGENDHVSFNFPSTDTEYHAYTGNAYAVTFPDGQTIYGGTLDMTTGVLTVTHKMLTLTGNEGWQWSAYGSSVYTKETENGILADSVSGQYIKGFSSMVPADGSWGLSSTALRKSYSNYGLQFYNCVSYWGLSEVSVDALLAQLQEWNTNGTPLQICYELATPETIQLDPVTIQTLIGNNTVWTDTNGTNTVVYLKKK